MYAHNPALHHQKADPLTVCSSCSSRRCVSPRRRTKRRCSAQRTPDTPNPSLLFSAGKVLPSPSGDQIKSLLSSCVNTRGQLADTDSSSRFGNFRAHRANATVLAAVVCLHTGATCPFCRGRPAPLMLPTNRNVHIYIPRPQQRHETTPSSWHQKTQKQALKKDKKIYKFWF